MMEIAKDRKSCRSEVFRTADFVKFTADTAKNLSGESIPGDSFPGFKNNKVSILKREPLGVVLAISPFNYPINLSASKIAPGLMAGNSVVLKPATQGSLCGLYLARIFEKAGVPAGVLNTITVNGSEIGDYITTHKEINCINFTGSTEVGARISKMTSMVPLLMELGGKEAFYVADKLEVGTVQINNKTERGPDNFPFMGVKASGIGTQGIKYSIESMSRPKATIINLLIHN